MPEAVIAIVCACVALFCGLFIIGGCVLIGLKAVARSLSELSNAIKERPATPAQTQYFSGQEDSKKEKPKEVGELPPEAIAPNFAKPPRPAGGFGSRDRK